MKKHYLLCVACIVLISLTGCIFKRPFYKAQVRHDLVNEHWIKRFNFNPNRWLRPADRWFRSPYTRPSNPYGPMGPNRSGTTMLVRLAPFHNVSVAGPYRVLIKGQRAQSGAYIVGTNEAVRHTVLESHGDTLYIKPAPDCVGCANLHSVTIRVSVPELNNLVVTGGGLVEAKNIYSSGLQINSTNCAQILVKGMVNLRSVNQFGPGTISVIGAITPNLIITDTNGTVNVAGRVGISRIVKRGGGSVNILGADSDGLDIDSQGNGYITVSGHVNLRYLNAYHNSHVYLYWINSGGVHINLHDHAHVGIAGAAGNVELYADGDSHFGGKYLHVGNIYVTTNNWAHANISPGNKLFANAMQESSVYFFTSPNVISRYTTGNGLVIPIFGDNCKLEVPRRRPPACSSCNTVKRMVPARTAYIQTVPVAPGPDAHPNSFQSDPRVTYGKYHL